MTPPTKWWIESGKLGAQLAAMRGMFYCDQGQDIHVPHDNEIKLRIFESG
jgi:hypothetical protein